MDLILLVFVALILLSIRPVKVGFEEFSVGKTKSLKGMMAVLIILHHMSEKVTGGVLFSQLQHVGYLVVAVFFFVSGYGLMEQYIARGESYLKRFWVRRVLPLVAIYILVSILYALFDLLIGKDISIYSFFESFWNGHPIATNSWYIIVQLLCYALFYLSVKVSNNKVWVIYSLFFSQILLTGVFMLLEYSSIWYISNYAFVVGVAYSINKKSIDSLTNKRWFLWSACLLLLFILFSGLPLAVDNKAVRLISRILSSAIFAAFIVHFMKRLSIVDSFIWRKLGEISLEIYLLHGLVITLLRCSLLSVNNDTVWTILSIVISIGIAFLIHPINAWIMRLCKR